MQHLLRCLQGRITAVASTQETCNFGHWLRTVVLRLVSFRSWGVPSWRPDIVCFSSDFDQCLCLVNTVKQLGMLAFCTAEKSSFTDFWQAEFGRVVDGYNRFSVALQTYSALRACDCAKRVYSKWKAFAVNFHHINWNALMTLFSI